MAVLITGTSKGIGRATAVKLIENGFTVYGISRTASDIDTGSASGIFHEYIMDLTNTGELISLIKEISEENDINILINNAGCGYYGLHEELRPGEIHEMITTNFEVPVLITGMLLKTMKKNSGLIINVSSYTAKNPSPHGAVYGATKAALTSFTESIFAEARKYGVRVTSIHPEMTATELYRNAGFEADTGEGCCLFPEDIADFIMKIINTKDGINISDFTILPQFHRIKKK